MPKKKKISDRLLEEGVFQNLKEATAWIMTGAVFAGTEKIASPGQLVPADAPLRVNGLNQKYVGRGGFKLEGAIERLPFSPKDKVALDCGASTGGFTDCLLQHGASLVYAVDVGFGQLHGSLRQDARVVNLERVNLGDEKLLTLDPKPEVMSLDLSYLSLEKAIPLAERILRGQGEAACLVKPLFEVPDMQSRRSGVIGDNDVFRELLHRLAAFVRERGYSVFGICASPIRGGKDSVEFFLGVRFGAPGLSEAQTEEQIENAMCSIAPMQTEG